MDSQSSIIFSFVPSSATDRPCNTEEGEPWGGGPLGAVHLHTEHRECDVRLEKTILPSTFCCAGVK